MRAIPSAMDAASVGCKRSHATDADGQGECPVCLNEFEASGPRTKVRPYICDNHAICSACDRTLYVRHDDRCPICRTGRSGASAERNGPRPFALPPAMDFPVVNGAHSYQATRIENGLADVMSWLPRRFFANGRSVVDGNNVARSPLSDWAAQYNTGGGRVFYTDPDELEEWQAEGGTGADQLLHHLDKVHPCGIHEGVPTGAHTLVECLSREETEGGGKETREGRESLGEVIEGGASLNADLPK